MEISIKWNLCRVCLASDKKDMMLLFNDAKLADIIKECTGKTVEQNDGLPDQICLDCINGLNETHAFLTKFKKSDDHLTSIVQRTMSTRSLIKNDSEEEKNASKEEKADESSNNSVLNCKVKPNKRLAKDTTTIPYKILFSSDDDVKEQRKKKSNDSKDNANPKIEEDSGSDDHNDSKTEILQTINEEIYIDELCDINKSFCSDDEGDGGEDYTSGNHNDYIIVLNDNKTTIKRSQLSNDDDDDGEDDYETNTNEENEQQIYHYKDDEFDNASNQGDVYLLSDINSIEQMIEEDDDEDEIKPVDLYTTEIEDQDIILKPVLKRSKKYTVKSHMCTICNNTFTRASSLKTHMRRHKNVRKFKCEICEKQFASSHNLANHMRIHTGEKPFVCAYCQRRFSDRSTHLKHTRIHTNERPFKCDECGKCFTLSTTLKAHEIIHTGMKPHQCLKCNKAFKLPHQLKAHMNTFSHKLVDEVIDLDY